MTLEELAAKAGIGRVYLARLEPRGRIHRALDAREAREGATRGGFYLKDEEINAGDEDPSPGLRPWKANVVPSHPRIQ